MVGKNCKITQNVLGLTLPLFVIVLINYTRLSFSVGIFMVSLTTLTILTI